MILQTGKSNNGTAAGLKRYRQITVNSTRSVQISNRGFTWSLRIEAGFTLVEILVAVSILAIAIITIFQVFIVNWDARLRSEDYTRAVIIAIEEMEKAIEQTRMGEMMETDGSLAEEKRQFDWRFTDSDVDVEDYPKLKEINMETEWKEGKRSGRYVLSTFFFNPILD